MIYTAPYVMCLMGANPLQGSLEGLGHASRDFLGPETALELGTALQQHNALPLGYVATLLEINSKL